MNRNSDLVLPIVSLSRRFPFRRREKEGAAVTNHCGCRSSFLSFFLFLFNFRTLCAPDPLLFFRADLPKIASKVPGAAEGRC
ncbi:hypothetical protein B6K86_09295 [Lachnospiraceae bacterium]|nr:hypothetical protein B6K86_09295 [Lachnospiraceae bacterium]